MSSGSRSSCDSGVGSGREEGSPCGRRGAVKTPPPASLRVTFHLPKEAAGRLRALAHSNPQTLHALGIIAVHVDGDAVSITLAHSHVSPARNATGGLDSGSSAASAPATTLPDFDSGIDSAPSNNGSTSHATPPQLPDPAPDSGPWIEGVKRSVLGYLQSQETAQPPFTDAASTSRAALPPPADMQGPHPHVMSHGSQLGFSPAHSQAPSKPPPQPPPQRFPTPNSAFPQSSPLPASAANSQSDNPMTSMEQMLAQRTIVSSSPLLVNLLRSNSPNSHYTQAAHQQPPQTSESYFPGQPAEYQEPQYQSQAHIQPQPQPQPAFPDQRQHYYPPQAQAGYPAQFHHPSSYPSQQQLALDDDEPAAKRRKKRKKPTKAELAAAAAAAAALPPQPQPHPSHQPAYAYQQRPQYPGYPGNGTAQPQPAWGYPNHQQMGYPQHHYPNNVQAPNPHGYPQQQHHSSDNGVGGPQSQPQQQHQQQPQQQQQQQPPPPLQQPGWQQAYPPNYPQSQTQTAESKPVVSYPSTSQAPQPSIPTPTAPSQPLGRDNIDTSIDEVVRKTRTDEFDTNFHNSSSAADIADFPSDPGSDDSTSRDTSSTGSAIPHPVWPMENGLDHHHTTLKKEDQRKSATSASVCVREGWGSGMGRGDGDADLYGSNNGLLTSHGSQSQLLITNGGVSGGNGANGGVGAPAPQPNPGYHEAPMMCTAQPQSAAPATRARNPAPPRDRPESRSPRLRRPGAIRSPPAAPSPPPGDLAVAIASHPPLSPSGILNLKRAAAALVPGLRPERKVLTSLELENNRPASPLPATCRLDPPPPSPPPQQPLSIEVSPVLSSGPGPSPRSMSSLSSVSSGRMSPVEVPARRSRRRAAVLSAALLRHSLGILDAPRRRTPLPTPSPAPTTADPETEDGEEKPVVPKPPPGQSDSAQVPSLTAQVEVVDGRAEVAIADRQSKPGDIARRVLPSTSRVCCSPG